MPKVVSRGSSRYLTRRRWTEDDAREALGALDESGQKLEDFAVRVGVEPQRLSRWRRRLGVASAVVFHEVVPALAEGGDAARSAVAMFEIVLASGRVVRVPCSFDEGALRRLLAVVEEAPAC